MRTKATLCWKCENACSGCSWSDGTFTPVEGWTVKKTRLRDSTNDGYMDSYIVNDCPKFADDTKQYHTNYKMIPIAQSTKTATQRRIEAWNKSKSPQRRSLEALPIDELEKRIQTLAKNREIARLALIEKKTYAEISREVDRSVDAVRHAVVSTVQILAEVSV